MKVTEGSVYCLPKIPHQNGDLWIEITLDNKVQILDPAGLWWRGKTFTIEEFNQILRAAK